MFEILFICSGNTCRSPMAEIMMNDLIKNDSKLSSCVIANSCGLYTMDGLAATQQAINVMEEKGLDLSHHHSKQCTDDFLKQADLIITMTNGQLKELLKWRPDIAVKSHMITSFAYDNIEAKDIEDPYMSNDDTYRNTARQIYDALLLIKDRLKVLI